MHSVKGRYTLNGGMDSAGGRYALLGGNALSAGKVCTSGGRCSQWGDPLSVGKIYTGEIHSAGEGGDIHVGSFHLMGYLGNHCV